MSRKQKKVLCRIIIAFVLTIIVWVLPIDNKYIKLAMFVVPYLIIGYDVLLSALKNIFHGQMFDEKFLMSLATIGAFVIDEYPEAVSVMIFYQIGEWFQSIAVGKSRKSIQALMDIRPDSARVERNGEEIEVYPDEIAIGEIIVVRPGERIALDGIMVEGNSSLDTSALTGESVPSDKKTGDSVISGSVNLTSLIKIKVTASYEESTVSKILELIENSSSKKAKIESFITRFSKYYTPIIVCSSVVLVLALTFIFKNPFYESLKRALTFLVVSCPCALVVSIPLSFFGGIGGASKEGVLIKGANYLELLASIDTVVFDKTGTLTEGFFELDDIHAENIEKEKLLEIAAHAESNSNHPIGESITREYKGEIDRERIGSVKEIAGKGIEASIDGKSYFLGNISLMQMLGINIDNTELPASIVYIAEKEGRYLGYISVKDKIKKDSKEAVSKLKALGIKKTVMLTGDVESVAERVSKEVGIDEIHHSLLPDQKVEIFESLLSARNKVAFVGDGINDAPVLSRADVGVAMGALGSDAAIEAADIVLMDDDPKKLCSAIRIARKSMRIVYENIYFALGAKFIILILGALGFANIWLAVFGDVGILILAILNAMRLIIGMSDKKSKKKID